MNVTGRRQREIYVLFTCAWCFFLEQSRVTAALNKLVQTPGRHQTPRARASAKSPIRVPVYIFVFSGAFNKPLFAVSLLGPASGNGGWGALWRRTTLSQRDGVCRNASIFFYSIIIIAADVIVTTAIPGSGWSCWDQKAGKPNGKTETLQFKEWIRVV